MESAREKHPPERNVVLAWQMEKKNLHQANEANLLFIPKINFVKNSTNKTSSGSCISTAVLQHLKASASKATIAIAALEDSTNVVVDTPIAHIIEL